MKIETILNSRLVNRQTRDTKMFKNNDKLTINPIRVHRNKFIAQMPLWDQLLHQFHELPKDRQDEILYRIYRKLFIANSKELIIQAKA